MFNCFCALKRPNVVTGARPNISANCGDKMIDNDNPITRDATRADSANPGGPRVDIFTHPRQSQADVVTGALLDGFNNNVLVGFVIFLLNEVVKEARPRFGIVVGAEVAVSDGFDQVEEHVPRIAGDAVGRGLR